MKRKKFKPAKILIESPNDLFEDNKYEISVAIIKAIKHALEFELDSIDFAVVLLQDFASMTLTIDRDDFEDSLEANIKIMEEFERYEACQLITTLQEKLKISSATVKKTKKRVETPLIKAKKKK